MSMIGMPGEEGGATRNTTMNLLGNDPTTPTVVPAPPVKNPLESAAAAQNATSPPLQPVDPDAGLTWLIVATEEEWGWGQELLAAWFDPAITDKSDLADQMNQLLGVMMNEVKAQRDVRHETRVASVEASESTSGPVLLNTIGRNHTSLMDEHKYVRNTVCDIENRLNDIAISLDGGTVDRNALSMAVMRAFITASPGTDATSLMALVQGVVEEVCNDA